MNKKVLSFVLASTMALSASGVVSAAPWDGTAATGTGDAGATVKVPTIDITLPTFTTTGLYFDIYNQLGLNEQVISPTYSFTNNSTVPVQVKLDTIKVAAATTTLVPSIDPTGADLAKFDGTDPGANIALYIAQAAKELPTGKDLGNDKKDADGKLVWATIPTTSTEDGGAKYIPVDAYTAAAAVPNLVLNMMARGKEANLKDDGTMEEVAIDATKLGTKNTLSFRFGGQLNPNATAWTDDETITITPVFSATVLPLDLEDEGAGAQADVALSGVASTAAIIKVGTSSTAKYTVTLPTLESGAAVTLKRTLTASDYELTVTAADGTPKTMETAPTAAVAGNIITFTKFKCGTAAATDILHFTLKASAFEGAGAAEMGDSVVVDTILK